MVAAQEDHVAAQRVDGLAELALAPEDRLVRLDDVVDRRWALVGGIGPEVKEIAEHDELRDGIRRVGMSDDVVEHGREIGLVE